MVTSLQRLLEEEQMPGNVRHRVTTLDFIMTLDELRDSQVVRGTLRFPDGGFYVLAYAMGYSSDFDGMMDADNWDAKQRSVHAQVLKEFAVFTQKHCFPVKCITHSDAVAGSVVRTRATRPVRHPRQPSLIGDGDCGCEACA